MRKQTLVSRGGSRRGLPFGSLALGIVLLIATRPHSSRAQEWSIFITNDNCPDYTWGLDEQATRKAFAGIVAAHLDEMARTDAQPAENRDRYNAAVTQEVLCFLEQYPRRKDELLRRVREGRLYVSPFLCNNLWGFQSVEGVIRTLYPARRLERLYGVPMDVAEHIEQPNLPWGMATVLAGCGVRWLSVPFYNYDSTLDKMTAPPLFELEGPDGSKVRVVMDRHAGLAGSYTQGAHVLRDGGKNVASWLSHYQKLGADYPPRAVLASGTHGDISPSSGAQARGFAQQIIDYNARPDRKARLINATLPMFCKAVDEAHARQPFLKTIRGDLGHSWDLWPVSLAAYAAAMREGERQLLAGEALLAIAGDARAFAQTREARERANWRLAMLGDHAWNGTDERNKRHNAQLRRDWARGLNDVAAELQRAGCEQTGLEQKDDEVVLFNSLSMPRQDVVSLDVKGPTTAYDAEGKALPSQFVRLPAPRLYFRSPLVPGFGFASVRLVAELPDLADSKLSVSPGLLHGPYAEITFSLRGEDGKLQAISGKGIKTRHFDGQEHRQEKWKNQVICCGAVLARVRGEGIVHEMSVSQEVTIYRDIDRVDLDFRVRRPVSSREQRLCQIFPFATHKTVLHVDTTGAVVRPYPQPKGDLLSGADTRRLAVQSFVAAEDGDQTVVIAPLDCFAMRLDLGEITLEALGNDQNYREVTQDQDGVTEFRFRYAVRVCERKYDSAEAFAFAQSAATPLLVGRGKLRPGREMPRITVDPARAVATCLKPAEPTGAGAAAENAACDGSILLRLRETAGRAGPIEIGVSGFRKAVLTDLLERDINPLEIQDGKVRVDVRGNGLAAVRLFR